MSLLREVPLDENEFQFSDEQILEAVVMTGLAKFANLLSLGLGAVPDFEPRTNALPRE